MLCNKKRKEFCYTLHPYSIVSVNTENLIFNDLNSVSLSINGEPLETQKSSTSEFLFNAPSEPGTYDIVFNAGFVTKTLSLKVEPLEYSGGTPQDFQANIDKIQAKINDLNSNPTENQDAVNGLTSTINLLTEVYNDLEGEEQIGFLVFFIENIIDLDLIEKAESVETSSWSPEISLIRNAYAQDQLPIESITEKENSRIANTCYNKLELSLGEVKSFGRHSKLYNILKSVTEKGLVYKASENNLSSVIGIPSEVNENAKVLSKLFDVASAFDFISTKKSYDNLVKRIRPCMEDLYLPISKNVSVTPNFNIDDPQNYSDGRYVFSGRDKNFFFVTEAENFANSYKDLCGSWDETWDNFLPTGEIFGFFRGCEEDAKDDDFFISYRSSTLFQKQLKAYNAVVRGYKGLTELSLFILSKSDLALNLGKFALGNLAVDKPNFLAKKANLSLDHKGLSLTFNEVDSSNIRLFKSQGSDDSQISLNGFLRGATIRSQDRPFSFSLTSNDKAFKVKGQGNYSNFRYKVDFDAIIKPLCLGEEGRSLKSCGFFGLFDCKYGGFISNESTLINVTDFENLKMDKKSKICGDSTIEINHGSMEMKNGAIIAGDGTHITLSDSSPWESSTYLNISDSFVSNGAQINVSSKTEILNKSEVAGEGVVLTDKNGRIKIENNSKVNGNAKIQPVLDPQGEATYAVLSDGAALINSSQFIGGEIRGNIIISNNTVVDRNSRVYTNAKFSSDDSNDYEKDGGPVKISNTKSNPVHYIIKAYGPKTEVILTDSYSPQITVESFPSNDEENSFIDLSNTDTDNTISIGGYNLILNGLKGFQEEVSNNLLPINVFGSNLVILNSFLQTINLEFGNIDSFSISGSSVPTFTPLDGATNTLSYNPIQGEVKITNNSEVRGKITYENYSEPFKVIIRESVFEDLSLVKISDSEERDRFDATFGISNTSAEESKLELLNVDIIESKIPGLQILGFNHTISSSDENLNLATQKKPRLIGYGITFDKNKLFDRSFEILSLNESEIKDTKFTPSPQDSLNITLRDNSKILKGGIESGNISLTRSILISSSILNLGKSKTPTLALSKATAKNLYLQNDAYISAANSNFTNVNFDSGKVNCSYGALLKEMIGKSHINLTSQYGYLPQVCVFDNKNYQPVNLEQFQMEGIVQHLHFENTTQSDTVIKNFKILGNLEDVSLSNSVLKDSSIKNSFKSLTLENTEISGNSSIVVNQGNCVLSISGGEVRNSNLYFNSSEHNISVNQVIDSTINYIIGDVPLSFLNVTISGELNQNNYDSPLLDHTNATCTKDENNQWVCDDKI